MKVILIGYRACGKSTVGKLLATKLKIPLWDTDLLIEESLGMPIKEIVVSQGWDFFRAREKETIQKLEQNGACVIATGGGAVLSADNIDLLKKMGFVVWLTAPLADIVERLAVDAESQGTRPQFTADSLVEETAAVLQQRIPLYEKAADYSLDTAGKSAEQVAEEISGYLESRRISE
ncbi:MAG: shikimate kinase [Deltaproteobacteria bacterium HGW-Deltaproteobacteria-9]|nr:MAG: shikimate kinase [Deltaproteobacteria bacterium HGW-Deltaproteobacteria-9]